MEYLVENELQKALSLTASSEDVLYQVENAYARRLSELYKSDTISAAAKLTVDIELAVAGVYNRLAILNHNIVSGDIVKIYYDIGAGWVELETVADVEDEQYFYHQMAAIPANTTDLRLEIEAGAEKVFSFGWIFFGNALLLSNPKFGSTPKYMDADHASLSWSRQSFVDEGLGYRTQQIEFESGTETEFENLLTFWKDGTLRAYPGLFVQFPETPYSLLEPYFAKLKVNMNNRIYGGVHPFSVSLEEVF